jgi:phosphate:Na+ symporter
MVLALASINLIELRGAIPLILGCNIGTCITAAIASIGTNVSARRAMMAHVLFNVIGVLIFLPFLGPLQRIAELTSGNLMRQIANTHTIFNFINTLIFLPFTALYVKLLTRIVPGKEEEDIEGHSKYLEKHLLATPPIALEAATREIIRTLGVTQRMMNYTMTGFMKNDMRSLSKVAKSEEAVDSLRTAITKYLIDLMQQDLTAQQSIKIPALIHVINDVERIGDHAENLMQLTEQKIESRLMLTSPAVEELKSMHDEVSRMAAAAVSALETNNIKEAERIIEQEVYINSLRNRLKDNHVKRLEQKQCNVLSGVVFLDMISNYEKIGDHLTNIAQKITEDLQWNAPTV